MTTELRDAVVVLTGATGGIGAALARRIAAEAPRLLVCADLQADAAAALAAELNSGARRELAIGRRCDVGTEADVKELIDVVTAAHGVIDVYFANAGVATLSDPLTDDAVWDRAWRVNTMAHVWAARHLLPGWLERGRGHLVTTASIGGILTALGDAAYSTSKHATVGFAEWMAVTYRDRGIAVSCVCPAGVRTPMLALFAGDLGTSAAVQIAGELMAPADAADIIVNGVVAQDTLILTHPEVRVFMERKVADHTRWINGMARQARRDQELLGR